MRSADTVMVHRKVRHHEQQGMHVTDGIGILLLVKVVLGVTWVQLYFDGAWVRFLLQKCFVLISSFKMYCTIIMCCPIYVHTATAAAAAAPTAATTTTTTTTTYHPQGRCMRCRQSIGRMVTTTVTHHDHPLRPHDRDRDRDHDHDDGRQMRPPMKPRRGAWKQVAGAGRSHMSTRW
jgi:hypothetical protein